MNTTKAHIFSLGGEIDEITILEYKGNNNYIVDYRGVKCTAIFNIFDCSYYADDIFGVVVWKITDTNFVTKSKTIVNGEYISLQTHID